MLGISKVYTSVLLVVLGVALVALLYYSSTHRTLSSMEGSVRVSEMTGIEILGMSPDGPDKNRAVIIIRSMFRDTIPYEGASSWQVFIDRNKAEILELNPPSGILKKGEKLIIKVDFSGYSWRANHEIDVFGPKGARAKFIWIPP